MENSAVGVHFLLGLLASHPFVHSIVVRSFLGEDLCPKAFALRFRSFSRLILNWPALFLLPSRAYPNDGHDCQRSLDRKAPGPAPDIRTCKAPWNSL